MEVVPMGHSLLDVQHCYPTRDDKLLRKSCLQNGAGSLRKNKSVHFADSCGFQLCSVLLLGPERNYLMQRVPRAASSPSLLPADNDAMSKGFLLINFTQPHRSAEFSNTVEMNYVALESVCCSKFTIGGSVAVKNQDFCKEIFVRVTYDAWRTFRDYPCIYLHGVSNGQIDKFTFEFVCIDSSLAEDDVLVELAVCYRVLGNTYWDNNYGDNYRLLLKKSKLVVERERRNTSTEFLSDSHLAAGFLS